MDNPDGADGFVDRLLGFSPAAYQQYAEFDCGVDVSLEAVREVCALRPLTERTASGINPMASLTQLLPAITRIGYPQVAG
ncbi:hypothetical protein ACPA54_24460 [Uniformispora flossi]|uniref:hypothetical protein n=1 Tax=Uniformispora flossi TaxID=3390723 RepID=UPI003C2C235C